MGGFMIGDFIAQAIFAFFVVFLVFLLIRFIRGGNGRKNGQLSALEERVDRLEKQFDKK